MFDGVDRVTGVQLNVNEHVQHLNALRFLNRHQTAVAVVNQQVASCVGRWVDLFIIFTKFDWINDCS